MRTRWSAAINDSRSDARISSCDRSGICTRAAFPALFDIASFGEASGTGASGNRGNVVNVMEGRVLIRKYELYRPDAFIHTFVGWAQGCPPYWGTCFAETSFRRSPERNLDGTRRNEPGGIAPVAL